MNEFKFYATEIQALCLLTFSVSFILLFLLLESNVRERIFTERENLAGKVLTRLAIGWPSYCEKSTETGNRLTVG